MFPYHLKFAEQTQKTFNRFKGESKSHQSTIIHFNPSYNHDNSMARDNMTCSSSNSTFNTNHADYSTIIQLKMTYIQ